MFTLPNRNVLRKRVCGNVLRIFFDAINQNVMYNRGIQMYRFPNSDVQKSVIFEGIKKRLKIV